LAARAGGTAPEGLGNREFLVLGLIGGIGFTVSLFLAEIAVGGGDRVDEARLAIVTAGVVAGLAATVAAWGTRTREEVGGQ
jgi:NhaA family Na+:H+ antiporter